MKDIWLEVKWQELKCNNSVEMECSNHLELQRRESGVTLAIVEFNLLNSKYDIETLNQKLLIQHLNLISTLSYNI